VRAYERVTDLGSMNVGYQYSPVCPEPLSYAYSTPGSPLKASRSAVVAGYWNDGHAAYTVDVFPQKDVS